MGNCLSITFQSNATDSTFSQCFACTDKRAKFINALEENLDALKTALEELTDSKNDLLRRVNIAELQQQLKRLDKVQRWITRVEEMENEVKELLSRSTQEVGELCLWGCCSKSYLSSYEYGKAVSAKLDAVIALQTKGDFEVVAENVLETPVVEMPLEPTVGMESLFDKVWGYLCDDNIRIMGLYGMGGVGKTTLMKKINNKFLETTDSVYSVMWIVVSKNHKFENIQNVLGEKLGFPENAWKRREFHEKAADIFRVLSRRKFVLLLDDIWERIDLLKLGVPLPEIQNGSKVIFTTRSKDVCSRMKADRNVEVECLAWEKSWKLFKEMVGEEALSAHPDILSLAEKVAKECGGLPLVLNTIGRTMACRRTTAEWRHALQVLKNSASDFSGMSEEVLPLLKLSYDNLPSEKVKSCFLYCALFPDDFMIDRKSLIEYWISEGFLDTDHDEIDEGSHIIGTLLYACLLEEEDDYFVKMHDVIREMALWIACDCGNTRNSVVVLAKVQLLDPPATEKWSEINKLSLMDNDIERLSGTPTCPNLVTLFLQSNRLREISESFFEVMPKLKVLDLSGNFSLTYLPVSISKLIALQYLDLSLTKVRELPGELGNLVMLKYMNLNHTGNLPLIPHQLMSNFSQMQVLKMFGCGSFHYQKMSDNIVRYESNEVMLVRVLQGMKHLNSLEVTITSYSALRNLFTSQELRNCTQQLFVQHLQNEHLLHISYFSRNYCNPLYFSSLHSVQIEKCQLLKDVTCLFYAPNLSFLSIKDCLKLEEIICLDKLSDAEAHPEPFQKLETFKLNNLPSLISIYEKPLSFPQLEIFEVLDCSLLRKLPISRDITNTTKLKRIQGEISWWNELIWDVEATRKYLLRRFKGVY